MKRGKLVMNRNTNIVLDRAFLSQFLTTHFRIRRSHLLSRQNGCTWCWTKSCQEKRRTARHIPNLPILNPFLLRINGVKHSRSVFMTFINRPTKSVRILLCPTPCCCSSFSTGNPRLSQLKQSSNVRLSISFFWPLQTQAPDSLTFFI